MSSCQVELIVFIAPFLFFSHSLLHSLIRCDKVFLRIGKLWARLTDWLNYGKTERVFESIIGGNCLEKMGFRFAAGLHSGVLPDDVGMRRGGSGSG